MSEAKGRVEHVGGGVFVARAPERVDTAFIDSLLNEVWQSPGWSQPWGLVVDLASTSAYDPDVRKARLPPKARRAAGTAIVSQNAMHKMVIRTIGLGMQTVAGFELVAYDDLEAAIDKMHKAVERCKDEGRAY